MPIDVRTRWKITVEFLTHYSCLRKQFFFRLWGLGNGDTSLFSSLQKDTKPRNRFLLPFLLHMMCWWTAITKCDPLVCNHTHIVGDDDGLVKGIGHGRLECVGAIEHPRPNWTPVALLWVRRPHAPALVSCVEMIRKSRSDNIRPFPRRRSSGNNPASSTQHQPPPGGGGPAEETNTGRFRLPLQLVIVATVVAVTVLPLLLLSARSMGPPFVSSFPSSDAAFSTAPDRGNDAGPGLLSGRGHGGAHPAGPPLSLSSAPDDNATSSSSADDPTGGYRFEVHGKVQGVSFRKYAQRRAREIIREQYREEERDAGRRRRPVLMVGWIRNTGRGTVEGEVASSTERPRKEFQTWLRTIGSPRCRIDKADFVNLDRARVEEMLQLLRGADGLEIRPTTAAATAAAVAVVVDS